MDSVSETTAWEVRRDRRVYGLQVVLRKRVVVLPWTQFLYAEGGSDEVRAIFSTHDVVVKGSGLEALLSDIAAEHVAVLREPSRPPMGKVPELPLSCAPGC